MASTKYVQKLKRKPDIQTKDEFFVTSSKVTTIKQFDDKIQRMYDISIMFEDEVDDGHWLILEGDSVDRRNAKNYINALCNPGETKQIQFPSAACAEFMDPMTLEQIEKQTNAVIRPLQKVAHFEICGTELAVTLAMSLMEELSGEEKHNCDDVNDVAEDDNDKNIITISPATNNGSNRLTSQLARALSSHSDGICSMDDYTNASASVKRILVNCLQDTEIDSIDDDLLFADGDVETSATPVDKQSSLKIYYTGRSNSNVDRQNSIEVDGPNDNEQTSPGISALTEKLTDANLLNSVPQRPKIASKQQEYLRSFGVSVGYKSDEVNEALQFVDDKTRPSDFLDLLATVKQKQTIEMDIEDASGHYSHDDDEDSDVILEETEIIHTDEHSGEASGGAPVVSKKHDSIDGKKGSFSTNLPEGYKEQLFKDFFTEDDNSSREELKRRNAQRQALLKQNFQQPKSQQQKVPQQVETLDQGQGGGAKSKKAKKKQKKKQQKGNKQNEQSSSSQHEKQLKLDVTESQTYSNDDDQTCVYKVWNPQGPSVQGQGQGPRRNSNSEPLATTPKRKQSQSSQNQRSQNNSQPIISKAHNQTPNPQNPQLRNNHQSSTNQQFQAGSTQWPGPQSNQRISSPNRAQQWKPKPTQVVTPVNTYPAPTYGRPLPPVPRKDEDDLRYIVIDGSNVAMTHGNGKYFSCKGLRIVVDYFKARGHDKLTVFVPQWRTYRPSDDNPIMDQHILYELKDEDILVFTPSRRIGRKLVVAYDDRFVLELAEAEDGIVISNDQYRDLMTEKASWKKLIEERLLMFSFARDRFMPPNDPLGRDGPCLDVFLSKQNKQTHMPPNRSYNQPYNQPYQPQQQQQHGYHQGGQGHFGKDQGHTLGKQSQGQQFKTPIQRQFHNPSDHDQQQHNNPPNDMDHGQGQSNAWRGSQKGQGQFGAKSQRCVRTDEESDHLFKELRIIFPEPDQDEKVRSVLENHDREKDLTKLTNYCMSVLF